LLFLGFLVNSITSFAEKVAVRVHGDATPHPPPSTQLPFPHSLLDLGVTHGISPL
jgi:hypothetical protein